MKRRNPVPLPIRILLAPITIPLYVIGFVGLAVAALISPAAAYRAKHL